MITVVFNDFGDFRQFSRLEEFWWHFQILVGFFK